MIPSRIANKLRGECSYHTPIRVVLSTKKLSMCLHEELPYMDMFAHYCFSLHLFCACNYLPSYQYRYLLGLSVWHKKLNLQCSYYSILYNTSLPEKLPVPTGDTRLFCSDHPLSFGFMLHDKALSQADVMLLPMIYPCSYPT
jgi:hypothetical protein